MPDDSAYRFVIQGHVYFISRADVLNEVKGKRASGRDGRNKYYVQLEGQQFPIKQILHFVTKKGNAEFQAVDARRVLTKLEFEIKEWQYPPRPHSRQSTTQWSPSGNSDDQPPREDRDSQEEGAGRAVMKARKFAVSLSSDEDGFVVAGCPALPGCHSQGRTRQEALNNIKEAIRGYVASMRKHEEPVPEADWEVVEVIL